MHQSVLLVACVSVALVTGNRQGVYGKRTEIFSTKSTVGRPWPLPQVYTPTQTALAIDPLRFRFSATGETCHILEEAFSRYHRIIFGQRDSTLRFVPRRSHGNANQLDQLAVSVKTPCNSEDYSLSLESDESYTLRIGSDQANLNAKEVWGALRGLETVSQIIWRNGSQYVVNSTDITDFPRFKHRGVLLDTSRHFLSVHTIKENIDIMAQNKFNVFHWHIVDDQAFPFESLRFPDLSVKGAYPPAETHTYSQQNVKDILEFARIRGVRVIPEFDTPGHSLSWGKGQPGLLTECYTGEQPNGNYGPIDPSLNSTWPFISDFFAEVTSLFKDNYIHLGGDEVSLDCWKSNPNIAAFIKKEHLQNYVNLEAYYIKRLSTIIMHLKKDSFMWQEAFDNYPTMDKNTVIHVWKQGYKDELANVTKAGYKALLSACWDLSYISDESDWEKFYTCDPEEFDGTEAQKQLVMGGEALLWGLWVDDTNVVSRLWPRASAVAERLWSSKNVTDITSASMRMEEHRCRLIKRGFPAEPINGPSYCAKEFP